MTLEPPKFVMILGRFLLVALHALGFLVAEVANALIPKAVFLPEETPVLLGPVVVMALGPCLGGAAVVAVRALRVRVDVLMVRGPWGDKVFRDVPPRDVPVALLVGHQQRQQQQQSEKRFFLQKSHTTLTLPE
jgi:hypothetical protein